MLCGGCGGMKTGRAWRRHVGAEPGTSESRVPVALVAQASARPADAPPLTRRDLVEYMMSGMKPRDKWMIGTEHEKFGFELDTLKRLPYEGDKGIRAVLLAMQERFGWQPIMEGSNIIGLKEPSTTGGPSATVTLEPGGQLELSGAPLQTIHQTCAEVNSHLYQVKAVAEDLGVGFIGLGFDPKWKREEIPWMPKGRYKIMGSYMPKRGSKGLDMMLRTCTIQVNLDFDTEETMARMSRVSMALQPVATALFACSPFIDGRPAGVVSARMDVWNDTDPDRTGDLPFLFEDGFGFERYADYILDVPMYFVYRDGKYIDCAGLSFKDFMEGKLPTLPGEYPTLQDWEDHLTTSFPDIRVKRYIEMRGADGGPWRKICALPALWVGLLYDDQVLRELDDMIGDWTAEERKQMRDGAIKYGLSAPFQDGTVGDVAQLVVEKAKEGLNRRGYKEVNFLAGLEQTARTGVTPAEVLLSQYHGEWDGNIDHIYRQHSY